MRRTKKCILPVIPYVTGLCAIKREELKCGFERSITILAQNVLVPLPAMKFPPLLVWCTPHAHNELTPRKSETIILSGVHQKRDTSSSPLAVFSCSYFKILPINAMPLFHKTCGNALKSKVDVLTEVVLKLEFLNKILPCKI